MLSSKATLESCNQTILNNIRKITYTQNNKTLQSNVVDILNI